MPMCDDETDTCGCGKKGCLEQYTSANGITRCDKKISGSTSGGSIDSSCCKGIKFKRIFDAAKEGDPVALKMVERTGDMLGKALAMIPAS